jgi:hypothetical protein
MGIGGAIALLTNQPEDPIVTSWVNRTVLEGGSISLSARLAHDVFVKGCRADDIWAKMRSGIIMPFASNSWAGAMVPLIAPTGSTFTPVLLTASDYSIAGGIDPGAGNLDPKRIETNVNAQSLFSANSVQVSVYRPIYRVGRDSVANTLNGTDVQNRLQFHANWESGLTELDIFDYDTAVGRIQASGVNPVGLMTGSRLRNIVSIYKNATVQAESGVLSPSPVPNANINLLGCFISGTAFYSRSTSSYLYLGSALTPFEETLHYNRVQILQTALGRAV